MKFLADLRTQVEYLLSPPFCSYCLALLSVRVPLCAHCYTLIQPLATIDYQVTPTVSIPVRTLGAYEEPLKHFLLAKQYGLLVAAQQAGFLLAEHLAQHIFSADVLVPVPLHWRRKALRGYNQAEVIAHIIGAQFSIPVVPLVKRHAYTMPQMSRAAHERWDNVAQAFIWNKRYDPSVWSHKRIVIVDDLMTTGSTVKATARVLLPLKPSHLEAIVVARVL